jgi:peptide/nickel transport system substrate-binding protein
MPPHGSDGNGSDKKYSTSHDWDDTEYAQIDGMTRRKLMALGASASLSAMLAGCQDSGNDTPTSQDVTVDTDTEPGDEMDPTEASPGETEVTEGPGGDIEIRTTVQWDWPADETTLNYNSPSNFAGGYSSTFFHVPMTIYSKQTGEYYPIGLTELPTFDDCYQIHTFREETNYWWDGTEVNARDHVWGHQAQSYACCGGPSEVVWAAQPGESKYVFRENKGAPYAPRYAAGNALKGIRFKRDLYKPFVEKFNDASTEEEISSIVEEMENMNLTVANVEEHNNGNGLWKPVDWSADQITMEKHDMHPNADQTDIDRWVIQAAPQNQTRLQLINNDRVDIGDTSFQNQLNNPPQNLETVANLPGSSGKGLAFNWRNRHVSDRAFRRAIAYLLPMNNIAQAATRAGYAANGMDQQTASAPNNVISNLLGDDFLDQIIDYGAEARQDKATSVLENAGYSKQGGNWVGPEGNEVSLRIIARNTGPNANIGSSVGGLLSSFGINNNFNVLESGTYSDAYSGDAGQFDYDITLTGMGVDQNYADIMGEVGQVDLLDTGGGWQRPEPDECASEPIEAPRTPNPDVIREHSSGEGYETWRHGIQVTEDGLFPEVPTTIGQEDLSGETEQYPLASWALWSRYRFSDEELSDWGRKFLWWCNFHMSHVYIYQNQANVWMDTDNFQLRDGGKYYTEATDKYPHVFGDLVSK